MHVYAENVFDYKKKVKELLKKILGRFKHMQLNHDALFPEASFTTKLMV